METATTDKRTLRAIAAMFEAYNRKSTDAAITAYRWGLDGIPADAIERAVGQSIRRNKFMPTPAEIRDLAGHGEMSIADRAILAWPIFLDAMRRHGSYRSVSFDDRAMNATIRSLCAWDEDFPIDSYSQKRFQDAYAAFCRTGAGDGSPLIGSHDRGNRTNGFFARVKPPIAIATGLPPMVGHDHAQQPAIAVEPRRLALAENIGGAAE